MRTWTSEQLRATEQPNIWKLVVGETNTEDPLNKEHLICYVEVNNFTLGSKKRLPSGDQVTNIWYDHTAIYSRQNPNGRWRLCSVVEYHLDLHRKQAIVDCAARAWWSHVWGEETETSKAVGYWSDRNKIEQQPAETSAPDTTPSLGTKPDPA